MPRIQRTKELTRLKPCIPLIQNIVKEKALFKEFIRRSSLIDPVYFFTLYRSVLFQELINRPNCRNTLSKFKNPSKQLRLQNFPSQSFDRPSDHHPKSE